LKRHGAGIRPDPARLKSPSHHPTLAVEPPPKRWVSASVGLYLAHPTEPILSATQPVRAGATAERLNLVSAAARYSPRMPRRHVWMMARLAGTPSLFHPRMPPIGVSAPPCRRGITESNLHRISSVLGSTEPGEVRLFPTLGTQQMRCQSGQQIIGGAPGEDLRDAEHQGTSGGAAPFRPGPPDVRLRS
jgi:hypothetical protein